MISFNNLIQIVFTPIIVKFIVKTLFFLRAFREPKEPAHEDEPECPSLVGRECLISFPLSGKLPASELFAVPLWFHMRALMGKCRMNGGLWSYTPQNPLFSGYNVLLKERLKENASLYFCIR